MVQPDLVRSVPCWILSLPSVGLVKLGFAILSSTLLSLGPLVVCVASGSGSVKWTFFATGIGMI